MIRSLILAAGALLGLVEAGSLVVHGSSFTPDYVLRVAYQEAALACRYRQSAVVNGSIPGPTLYLKENQTTWIRVYNDYTSDNLTIHWHGLSEYTAPFSDGTPQASQWPIAPGHFFDYEIRPEIGSAGTYFYHSHVQFQAVTAAGPLIVEEASGKPPYTYDEEQIFFLSELFNKTDDQVVAGVTAPPNQFAFSGEAEAVLVNGNSYEAESANYTLTPPPFSYSPDGTQPKCQPEVFVVEPDKTYRFRSIGGVALSLVSFAFQGHSNLSVIEVDGAYTKPTSTDRIQIGAGQRFDFLLHTLTAEQLHKSRQQNFWIQLETRYRQVNVTSYAVLSYKIPHRPSQPAPPTAPTPAPLTLTNNIQNWLEYKLEPLVPNNFPPASAVSRTVYLRNDQLYAQSGIYWTVNNRTWTDDDEHLHNVSYSVRSPDVGVPYLVDIYKRGQAAIPNYQTAVSKYDGWDPNLNVYVGKAGEIIDIVLLNEPNGNAGGFDVHPWHIHGGHVWDLGSGPGMYDTAANEKRLKGYKPIMRDTSMLYKYTPTDGIGTLPPYSNQGWRAWRLRINDSGVWMVHCHILVHMVMGLQSVWVMGNASDITKNQEPYVTGYLNYGGSAYGNATYDPLVHEYFTN